jgi:hypothetical protein
MRLEIWQAVVARRIVAQEEDYDGSSKRVCLHALPGFVFDSGSHYEYVHPTDGMRWAMQAIDSLAPCADGATCSDCKAIEAERADGLRAARDHVPASTGLSSP